VSDPIARLLEERQALDRGLSGTLAYSLGAHLLLVGAALVLPWLMPREPPIRVQEVFAVPLPRGGGGTPAEPAPPAQAQAKPEPVESAAPPPPTAVLKPPPKAEPRPNALPLPNARTPKQPPTPPPVRATQRATPSTGTATSGSTAAGRGTSSATPGVSIGPQGLGVPTGTDSGGDWYLAGVQQKIWMLWNQQLKAGYTQSVIVTFTIQRSGEVTDVRVTQPSGVSLLDMAAQRAILSAAPFGPLPREYGQNSRTIEAVFKPTT
jgi:TonB family protein